jgi:hypothetical protein
MNNNLDNPDPISLLLGKIVIVETPERRFAGRLIFVNSTELWFESKMGARWMHNRCEIQSICLGKQVA